MRFPQSWRLIAAAFVFAATGCDSLPTENSEAVLNPSQAIVVIDGFTIARETLPRPIPTVMSKSAIIDPLTGGTITMLGHSITVPAGATDYPTLFTLAVGRTGNIEVDLSAMEIPPLGLPVLRTQFKKQIVLSLNYSRSPDRRVLRTRGVIVHVVSPSDATPVWTSIRPTQQRGVATLWHFSKYMMATN
jgi:hypothetical protein